MSRNVEPILLAIARPIGTLYLYYIKIHFERERIGQQHAATSKKTVSFIVLCGNIRQSRNINNFIYFYSKRKRKKKKKTKTVRGTTTDPIALFSPVRFGRPRLRISEQVDVEVRGPNSKK